MTTLKVGANFEFLLDNRDETMDKQGFVLEGSSGSGKTWDALQYLIYVADTSDKPKDILIARNTFADCKKTILKDFIKILQMHGMYNVKNHSKSSPQSYTHNGSIFYFSGLEALGSHGERHDIVYINEGMECELEAFQQLNQRCNDFFIIDYNPSFTAHWIYDRVCTRPDTKLFHSTLLGNAFLPSGQRKEILAYEPTAENIKNGTADDFMWQVYGLGLRTAAKGLILKYVNYIDIFPSKHDLTKFGYGLDFGYTNDPTALTMNGFKAGQLYTKGLVYEPLENPDLVVQALQANNVGKTDRIFADSADPESIRYIKNKGFNIKGVEKPKGSIKYGISLIKKQPLNIYTDLNYKREQENYKWREVNGIQINEPVDKFNHYIDSLRYHLLGLDQEKIFNVSYGV